MKTDMSKSQDQVKEPLSVYILMDMSGSMYHLKNDVIGMVAQYIDDLKEDAPDTVLSLSMFNLRLFPIFSNKLVKDAVSPGPDTYVPNDGTALIDACMKVVRQAEKDEKNNVAIVIVTDGYENSSKEHTKAELVETIKSKECNNDWSFVYMSANLSAFSDAMNLGFSPGTTIQWTPTSAGVASSGTALSGYTTMRTQNVATSWADVGYGATVEDKEE